MKEIENKPKGSPSDHLANERTFLAWIRTSIALMGFGFVIVKFALFIRQISVALEGNQVVAGKGYSAEIGVIMVSLGAIMTVLAFFRYVAIEKQLNSSSYFPSKWLRSILLILYLLPNIK